MLEKISRFQDTRGLCVFAATACFMVTANVSCSHTARRPFTKAEQDCFIAINTAHAQEESANSRKDINGVMAQCSPDYIATEPGGRTFNYVECREGVLRLFQTASSVKETNVIQSLHLTGNTAIVMVHDHLEATLPIPNPLTGKPMVRAQDHLDRETWVKGPNGWLNTKSDILQSSL